MELSKVKTIVRLVPAELTETQFTPKSFTKYEIKSDSKDGSYELRLEDVNQEITKTWSVNQCIEDTDSKQNRQYSDLEDLSDLAMKGYDVACLSITAQCGSNAELYKIRKSNLQYLMDTLKQKITKDHAIEYAFLGVTDHHCFDMRKQIKRPNEKILIRGMDSILKAVKSIDDIWKVVQGGCLDPFMLTIRITDKAKKTQGRIQYFDLLCPSFNLASSQSSKIDLSFYHLNRLAEFMRKDDRREQFYDTNVYVLTKELSKYVCGNNKLLVLGFINNTIVSDLHLHETKACLDFVALFRDIPVQMFRNRLIEETDEYKQLSIAYQLLLKEFEQKIKQLESMDSKQAKAIAVVDNMMAEGNELKKKYAELEFLYEAAEKKANCLQSQLNTLSVLKEFKEKAREEDVVISNAIMDIKDECIKDLNIKLKECDIDMKEVILQTRALEQKIVETEKLRQKDQTDVQFMNTQLKDSQKEADKMKAKLQEAIERRKKLEEELASAQDEKEFAQTQLRVTRQKIKEHAINVENLQNERYDIDADLKAAKDKLRQLQRSGAGDSNDLQQQLENANEKLKKCEEKYEKTMAEMEGLKKQYEERAKQLKADHKKKLTELKEKAKSKIEEASQEFNRRYEIEKAKWMLAVNKEEEDTNATKRKRIVKPDVDEDDSDHEDNTPPTTTRKRSRRSTAKTSSNNTNIAYVDDGKENRTESPQAPSKNKFEKLEAVEESIEKENSADNMDEQPKKRVTENVDKPKKKVKIENKGTHKKKDDTVNKPMPKAAAYSDDSEEVDIEGDHPMSPIEDLPNLDTPLSPVRDSHNLRSRSTPAKSPISLSKSKSPKKSKKAVNGSEKDSTKEDKSLPKEDTPMDDNDDDEAVMRSPILGAASPAKSTRSTTAAKNDGASSAAALSSQVSSQTSTGGTVKKRRKLRSTTQSRAVSNHLNDANYAISPRAWVGNQDL